MYHIKDDRRAIRSSEMIYQGLAQLMREKNYSAITVTDLVKASNVGRTTFYRNFDTIEDILQMRCDQVFEDLVRYIRDYRQTEQEASGVQMLKPVLRYFYLHSELIELLMIAKRVDIAQQAFNRVWEPFKSMFSMIYGIDAEYIEYIFAMRIGGLTNVLIHWIATGKKQAPDELADKLGDMIKNIGTIEQLL